MAGIRGRSGPPGNQNAFRPRLAGVAQRRADGILNPGEQSIREEILSGLLADKGEAAQVSTAMREIMARKCHCWLCSITQLRKLRTAGMCRIGDSKEVLPRDVSGQRKSRHVNCGPTRVT